MYIHAGKKKTNRYIIVEFTSLKIPVGTTVTIEEVFGQNSHKCVHFSS